MNEQERQVISDIFQRLEQVADQPRDPEAERFIAEQIRRQPYAPYAMAQAVYVQEQALARLQGQIQELQAEVERLRREGQSSGGSFLSGLFGGGSRQPEPPRPTGPSPWGQPAQQYPTQPGAGMPPPGGMVGQPGPWGMQPRAGGGGFLQGALATAAGVAGGMMIANALSSAFSGQHGNALGDLGANALGASGSDPAGQAGELQDLSAPLYQNAAQDDAGGFGPDGGGQGDFGVDDSGGGDDGDWT